MTGGLHISERCETVLVVTFMTMAGAFVRLYGLGEWDYFHDEIWHLFVTRPATLGGVFDSDIAVDGHPLLPCILWHYGLKLWDDPWMARLPSLIAGILAIPMGYFLGREIFETRAGGYFAAFFMAYSALMIKQSDVVRGYMLMTLFAMVAIWSVYRYRSAPRPGYLLLYFIGMFLAFSSEFAAAPIAVFTALFLLWCIARKQPRSWPALGLWVLIHLALLAYLAWFRHELVTVGHLTPDQNPSFLVVKNFPLVHSIAAFVWFDVNFLSEAGLTSLLAAAWGSEALLAVYFILSFIAVLVGIVWLGRQRQWWLLIWAGLTVAVGMAMYLLQIAPIDIPRRNIAFAFPYMILLYAGGAHLFSHIRWRPRPAAVALTCTALFSLGYIAGGWQWRIYSPYDFQQTRAQTKEIFDFLDNHVERNDIVLTDPSSYFHFLWHDSACVAKPVSAKLAYTSCYKAPLFVENGDMRTNYYILNMASAQDILKELDRMGRLDHVKNIWIVGIQLLGVKTLLLDPQYGQGVLKVLPPEWQHAPDVEQMIAEQEHFARYAYDNAVSRKIHYIYTCADPEHVAIGIESNCLMSFVALALPKKTIDAQFIHHAPYLDPPEVLRRVSQEIHDGKSAP